MIRRGLGAALLAALAAVTVADAQIIQPGPGGIVIQTQENTTLLGTQNKDKVQITGGVIDGTPIGSITPSTGAFTNLTFTGATISGSVTIGGTLGVTGATTLGTLSAGTTSVGALTATTTTLGATTAASLGLTAQLTVPNGGTGRQTLTNHGLLVGAGTTAITQLGVGATGTVLIGNTGADPSFTASPSLTSLILSGALTAGSAALTTSLPPSSGGTGLASGTRGGVLYFSASDTLASSAALTQNRLIVGGGPGTNYAPISLADQGSATKLLHGNAWGPPTWGALVNADVGLNTLSVDRLLYVGSAAFNATPYGVMLSRSSAGYAVATIGTAGRVLLDQGASAEPAFKAISGAVALTSAGVASLSLNQITNSLGADVALNNTANYFDGPTVAQGTTGTWFASGTVTLSDSGVNGTFYCKLWDGTTVISSASDFVSLGNPISISLSGFIASPAASIKISCKDITANTGSILFNVTGNSKDSTLSAFRIN